MVGSGSLPPLRWAVCATPGSQLCQVGFVLWLFRFSASSQKGCLCYAWISAPSGRVCLVVGSCSLPPLRRAASATPGSQLHQVGFDLWLIWVHLVLSGGLRVMRLELSLIL